MPEFVCGNFVCDHNLAVVTMVVVVTMGSPPLSCFCSSHRNHFYEMMAEKYEKPQISASVCRDVIGSLVKYAGDDKVRTSLAF